MRIKSAWFPARGLIVVDVRLSVLNCQDPANMRSVACMALVCSFYHNS
jgi:hypothetical protein